MAEIYNWLVLVAAVFWCAGSMVLGGIVIGARMLGDDVGASLALVFFWPIILMFEACAFVWSRLKEWCA